MMPDLDGLSFWRRASVLGCRAPLIVLSASMSTAEVAELMGAADYLAKPFDPDALMDRVRSVLGGNGTTSSAAATRQAREAA